MLTMALMMWAYFLVLWLVERSKCKRLENELLLEMKGRARWFADRAPAITAQTGSAIDSQDAHAPTVQTVAADSSGLGGQREARPPLAPSQFALQLAAPAKEGA